MSIKIFINMTESEIAELKSKGIVDVRLYSNPDHAKDDGQDFAKDSSETLVMLTGDLKPVGAFALKVEMLPYAEV